MAEDASPDSPAGEPGDSPANRPDGGTARPRQAPPSETFTWRGWVLVAMLGLSLLVIPGALLVLPAAQGVVSALGLPLRDAYLVLPLPAAALLGALAVWSALASSRE